MGCHGNAKNTISPWNFFEDFFSMKQDTFLILKLLLTFLKELVVGKGSFSAKCPRLIYETNKTNIKCTTSKRLCQNHQPYFF